MEKLNMIEGTCGAVRWSFEWVRMDGLKRAS
jgi:hypothetical protein